MGRGDKRTFKGKVFKGSYGKSRVRKARKTRDTAVAAAAAKKK